MISKECKTNKSKTELKDLADDLEKLQQISLIISLSHLSLLGL